CLLSRRGRRSRTRPVVILTRQTARASMTKVTVAPITSTIRGLSSEVLVGAVNGLDHPSAISLDNVLTIQPRLLGRNIGFLTEEQEHELAHAVVLAYDLELPLLR
ncbi:type II toxin-antitoxin system PemK/MazF family toxin, partial [Actinomyces viscosus]